MSAQTKYAAMSRRAAMTAAALAAMATLAGCGGGGANAAAEGDMAMGAAEGAKVTVIEYASVTCHVCAAWQKENWAAFKAAYVDTNKVRYVFRELPTGPVNVAVAGFMIARCAGDDKYFDVVHNILSSQDEWQAGVNPRDTLFLFYLGDLALAQQQFAEAEQRYQQVLAISPAHALALNNVAWLMLQQRKPGAGAYAERAVRAAPNRPALMDTLALAHAADGQPAKAIEVQRRALAMQPDDPLLRLNLARFYAQAGEKRAAKAELDRLAALGDRFAKQDEVATLTKGLGGRQP